MSKKLPTALVAVDICIFKIIDNQLCVYVTKVDNDNYKNMRCLPGGLIYLNENADETVKRIIEEKTCLEDNKVYREQLCSFSKVNRDKRSRVVSVAYLAIYSGNSNEGFFNINSIGKLAYDHNEILEKAEHRISSKLEYTTIVKKFMKNKFTYSELQKAYEVILRKEIDKRNFRKKIDSLDILKEAGTMRKEGRMRPAQEYTFKSEKVQNFKLFGEF